MESGVTISNLPTDVAPPSPVGFTAIILSVDPLSRHLRKIVNASSEEIMFFLCAIEMGLDSAILVAEGYDWPYQRPLLALCDMMNDMKSNPKTTDEYTNFQNALRTVLQVSKTELRQREAAYKAANEGKPKRGPKPKALASGHASDEQG